MLRGFVLAIGVAGIAGGAVMAVILPFAWPVALEVAIIGALILGSIFLERRYRKAAAAGPDWKDTGERFRDPISGALMEVRYNAATGERSYERIE